MSKQNEFDQKILDYIEKKINEQASLEDFQKFLKDLIENFLEDFGK